MITNVELPGRTFWSLILVCVWLQFQPATANPNIVKDCDICPEMIAIPTGSYTMGAPRSEKESDTT